MLARNQYNESEWFDMFTCSVSNLHYKNPINRVALVQSRYHLVKCNLFSP